MNSDMMNLEFAGFRLPAQTKAAIADLAWRERTTLSAKLREYVEAGLAEQSREAQREQRNGNGHASTEAATQ